MNAVNSVVFCTFTDKDTEIYQNLLPLFFATYPQQQVIEKEEAQTVTESKSTEVVEDTNHADATQVDESNNQQDRQLEKDIKLLEQLVDQIDFEEEDDIDAKDVEIPKSTADSNKATEVIEEKVTEQSQPVEFITVTPYTPI
jgi:hypothetical protein